ncbi:PAS domain-containing protein [Guyparkeria sp.]|uniref:PAS domain-containing protein n=1 Tax=Guyparkeria sp. TaxID=2035736 RepID=UPI003561B2F0
MTEKELSGRERELLESEIISTRTDERGVIKFINPVFTQVTGYSREDALGKPHNLIRHPDVPRAVYYLLWDQIREKRDRFFAVTKNVCKNGDHYWTIGYFQPEIGANGEITGFRSTRHGLHEPKLKKEFDQVYRQVREEELKHPRPKQIEAGLEALNRWLGKKGYPDYESFAKRSL